MAVAAACGTGFRVSPRPEAASPEVAYRLATEISGAASRLDVEAVARLMPNTDRVVYVSNGYPVTGIEYRSEIGEFYRSLKQLDWKWDKWQAVTISENAVVFTGWATVRVTPLDGDQRTERSIYTFTFARGTDGWKRVLGHKTKLADE